VDKLSTLSTLLRREVAREMAIRAIVFVQRRAKSG